MNGRDDQDVSDSLCSKPRGLERGPRVEEGSAPFGALASIITSAPTPPTLNLCTAFVQPRSNCQPSVHLTGREPSHAPVAPVARRQPKGGSLGALPWPLQGIVLQSPKSTSGLAEAVAFISNLADTID